MGSKKGFTLVELLGVIILIGVLALITISISNNIVERNREKVYKDHENKMIKAARDYVLTEDIHMPTDPDKVIIISLETLIDGGYISKIKDSKGEGSCTGHVNVRVNASGTYSYSPYLRCGDNYETPELVDISSPIFVGGISSWTNEDVTLTIVDESGLDNVARIDYRLDNGMWQEYTNQISFTNSGVTIVYARLVLDEGSVSDAAATTIRIDKDAPSCITSGGSDEWFNTNRTITGTCSDVLSGCTGNTQVSFSTDRDGYYSPGEVCDHAGNCTTCGTERVRIDVTTPICVTTGGSNNWYNTDRTLVGTCSDSGSGCVLPTVSETFTNDKNSMETPGEVCDEAGNCVMCPEDRVRIDKTNPTISYDPNEASCTNESVLVSVDTNDNMSGVNTVRRRLSSNGGSTYGSWTNEIGSYSVNLVNEGARRIQTEACDNAGNCTTLNSGIYNIDKSSPVITFTPISRTTWGNTDVSVGVVVANLGCGDITTVRSRASTNGGSTYGSWTNRGENFTINLTTNGENRIQVEACDSAGNCITNTSGLYRIDKIDPTVVHNPHSTTCTNENVSVSTIIEDSHSGVNTVRRRLSSNGGSSYGSWTNESGNYSLTLTSSGEWVIQTEACDNANNCVTRASGVHSINKSSPTITFTPNSRTTWGNTDVPVSVSINTHGCSSINTIRRRVSTNGGTSYGSWTNESGNFNINLSSNGENRIQVEACDSAGNCITSTSGIYRIDKASLAISFTPNSSGFVETLNVGVSITATTSGINTSTVQARVSTNGGTSYGSWFNLSSPYQINLNQRGTNVVQVRASNNAGTQTQQTSGAYQILSSPEFVFTASIPTDSRDFAFAINNSSRVVVHWEGSVFTQSNTSSIASHTFSSGGTKTVKVYGSPSRISFCRLMPTTFNSCDAGMTPEKLTNVTSGLPSSVTSTVNMFQRATNFNGNITGWDTSNVTDMSRMFSYASSFNRAIGSWNTSNVTAMTGMFIHASSFNQPIGTWNVGNVTDFSTTFLSASAFNQPIGTWNVGNATTLRSMFNSATSFNQPIGTWNVGNVTDMFNTFNNASSFNQPIGTWNTSKVTNMYGVFWRASSFNRPIGSWNTSNVTEMAYMFRDAHVFNQHLNTWCVSNISSSPTSFDVNAHAWTRSRPIWGTCP